MNIQNNGNLPILGRDKGVVVQVNVVLKDELLERMNQWAEKIGLPPTEITATIVRTGLVMFSLLAQDDPALTTDDTIKLIPLTDNEKKAFGGEA